MRIQAEVSLYPLRTTRLGRAIDRFLAELENEGLTVRKGSMSSTLVGDVDSAFAALGKAFKDIATDYEVVLMLKVSNACPRGGTESAMTDVQ